MGNGLFVFINILLYIALVTIIDGLQPGSLGLATALIAGGILFAIAAVVVEPILSFFKFPLNFWGLLVVGFILNLVLFIVFATGLLPPILTIEQGSLGSGFDPLPLPVLEIDSELLMATLSALIATLFQILLRRLGN
ncbi:MAG: hypothetical protein ACOCXP_02945 [Candidatus Dojkabacteria bacterium]